MSNDAGRTDNDSPVIWGVSHLDGVTPVQVKFDPSDRTMAFDYVTEIEFDPTINASVVPNNIQLALATSSDDNTTIRPWVVHATTGAVLVAA